MESLGGEKAMMKPTAYAASNLHDTFSYFLSNLFSTTFSYISS